MSYLDVAKDQVLGVVNKIVDTLPRRTAGQTVTIACPLERIEQFWRDPDQLSVVFGDIAVRATRNRRTGSSPNWLRSSILRCAIWVPDTLGSPKLHAES